MQNGTAGELRAFLTECLVDIRSGKLKAAEASALSKVAAQINQSLAVEINTALQLEKMGKEAPVVGTMLIGTEQSPPPVKRVESVSSLAEIENLIEDGKVWCDQCDERVEIGEARGCKSKHCSLAGKI